jgi:hypothetical protein
LIFTATWTREPCSILSSGRHVFSQSQRSRCIGGALGRCPLERVVTVELLWLKNWRLELIESIAELEEYELPKSVAPNGPSNGVALKDSRRTPGGRTPDYPGRDESRRLESAFILEGERAAYNWGGAVSVNRRRGPASRAEQMALCLCWASCRSPSHTKLPPQSQPRLG